MDKILNEIIQSDVNARKKLKQAEEYRKEQMAALPSRKEAIIKEENQKAIDKALKSSQASGKTAAQKLEEVARRNKSAAQKMEDLYKEKGSHWVKDMVNNIINS